ncbi:MAG: hypothetical protein JO257_38130 [Deltaproteobacteria bacterium]|nr:hypothetical protein [Deltaproteobacteria bacterium]
MKALLVLVLIAGVAQAGGRHCHETSPIVGREHCGGFGQRWAHDAWLGMFGYELAVAFEDVRIADVHETGTVYSATSSPAYHLTLAPGTRRMHAVGPRLRYGYRGANVTIGVEFTAGFAIGAPTLITNVDGFAPLSETGGTMFDTAGVVGYHDRFGALQLGGELVVGVQMTALNAALPPGFTTCVGGAIGKGCYLAATAIDLLVEPRARVDWWLTPQVTVGAAAGIDVASRGESATVILGFHLSAFDGN